MTDATSLPAWIAGEMRDTHTQWSAGTFGAIAEFVRGPAEPAHVACEADRCEAVTGRGGIRIDTSQNIRAVAYETISKDPDQWGHAVALCLNIADCRMNRRAVLTEIGPDAAALRPEDGDGILFDLGLGTLQVDVCVRTSEPDLLRALRAGSGQSLFEPGNPAMPAILAASPHRVFVTRIGRVEVFQPVPAPGGRSPDGPHTHILPKLLRGGRTHAATNPIPADWIPCAHLYPAHPRKDVFGRRKLFNRAQHESFQRLLAEFGDAELFDLKHNVTESVLGGMAPENLAVPENRFARANIRIALRQLNALGVSTADLMAWKSFYDRLGESVEEADEEVHA